MITLNYFERSLNVSLLLFGHLVNKRLIFSLVLMTVAFCQVNGQTYTFNNCGKIGNTGPTQIQCDAEYTSTPLSGQVTVTAGIQEWLVPTTGMYKIEAYGAQGSTPTLTTGGLGAYMSGEYYLIQGEVLRILVGQTAPNTSGRENLSSSGGGGTFVTRFPHNTRASILVIAGGGGGTGDERPVTSNGSILTEGQTGSHGAGGIDGKGGTQGTASAGAGAGFFTDGIGTGSGFAYINGGTGGPVNTTYSVNGGGFGGGGSVTSGGNSRYAGGGGYSGGSGSDNQANATTGLWGGGGGSFTLGINQNNIAGVREGNGLVVITLLPSCSTPLTAGATSASDSFVCQGSEVVLTLNGTSTGSGTTFQWQSSPDNINWTNIPGAISAGLITTVSVNTYYRAQITCASTSVFSTPYLVNVYPLFPGGTYTIGATGDFSDFNQAINAIMECGIAGPVVFNVLPGLYNEQVIIEDIPGASSTNTITFDGIDPQTRILTFNSTVSAERHTIRLDGARFVRIKNLTIENTSSNSAFIVHMTNGCEDIELVGNHIVMSSASATTTAYGCIVASGSLTSATTAGNSVNKLLIEDNKILNGHYGIVLTGVSTNRISDIQILSNQILNSTNFGINLAQTIEPIVIGNVINMSPSGPVAGDGISIATSNGPINFSKNYIANAGSHGILINAVTSTNPSNPSLISNNSIGGGFRGTVATSTGGIRMLGTMANVRIYNNSINFDSGAGAALNVRVSTVTGMDIRNNSLVYSGGGTGHAMYLNTATATAVNNLDYNNYLSNGSAFVHYGAARANLTTLRSVNIPVGNDQNSISVNPGYISSTNLFPVGSALYALGTALPGINTDINGTTRKATPDIGAYEVFPCVNPPSVGNVTGSSIGCIGQELNLSLIGNTTGFGQTYQWQSSATGGVGTWSNITGATSIDYSTIFTGTVWYRVVVTCGVSVETPPFEVVAAFSPLSGVYTVDPSMPASATNYQTLYQAIEDVSCGGLSGNVVFELAGTTFETAEIFPYIIRDFNNPGNFTLTIKPSTATQTIISGNSQNGIFVLKGASNVIIDGSHDGSSTKGLTLRNSFLLGSLISFEDGATNNIIRNANIEGGNISTISGLIHIGPGSNSNNSILNNNIGDLSISSLLPHQLIYSDASTSNQVTITGNNFYNWTSNAIRVTTTGGGDIWTISGNNFYQTSPRNTELKAIYVESGSGHTISNNSIGGSTPGRTGNPLTTTSIAAPAFEGIWLTPGTASTSTIYNNIIANIEVSGGFYGIRVAGGDVIVDSNIIGGLTLPSDSIKSGGASNYLLFSTGTGTRSFQNNLVSHVTTTGTGILRGFFANGNASYALLNNTFTYLTSLSTGTFYCINISSGVANVSGNTITNLTSDYATPATFGLMGIWLSNAFDGNIVENNIISDFFMLSTLNVASAGIYISGPTSLITPSHIRNNTIEKFGGNGVNQFVYGITAAGGGVYYSNNSISIGHNLPHDFVLDGIVVTSIAAHTNYFYHNSVSVGGSGSNISIAFFRSATSTAPLELRNNIFSNTRTGGTGHYAIYSGTAIGYTPATSDYNIFYSDPTSNLTYFDGTAYNLGDWKTNTGGDANTVYCNPLFLSNSLLMPAAACANNTATPLSMVTTDITGKPRNLTTPDMAAQPVTRSVTRTV